ncbi:PLP-dependent aminotransferase family protein, partial [Burkholderia cenocepacia]|nr:PLP-dependent aminotransferase family protein [Burkholderia cenocepacia]
RLQALAIRLLRRKPTLLTDAGPVGGSPEFRQTMAKRALSYGVTLTPDDVMSTSGGVDAVNLALRAVARPGDTIAIESPAFFGLIQLLESLGLRALEIPASPTTGLSIEALDVALAAYPDIRAVVVVPNLQNPLSCVMPDERKAALVALCSRHGVAVIEDEPYRELVEAPHAVRPVKAWDRDGTVIYCPSFNKVLAPGMRLGWMSAGRWHARVRMLKFAHSRHNAALLQAVAAEFVGSGAFDRHLHRFREQLRVQRDVTIDAIARHFPAGTRMNQPPGGMLLWIALPEGVRSDALFDAALAHGVKIAPGSIFSNSDRFDGYIRLACTRVFDAVHEAAFDTLGRLVREAHGGRVSATAAAGRTCEYASAPAGRGTEAASRRHFIGRPRAWRGAGESATGSDRPPRNRVPRAAGRRQAAAWPARSCPDIGTRPTERACAYARADVPRARRGHRRPGPAATPALGDRCR